MMVDLTEHQYGCLISALTEYDEVLADLFEDESVYTQKVQTFVRLCRAVTRERWEPPLCVKILKGTDQRGRLKQYQ